jgi:hypothetical protein
MDNSLVSFMEDVAQGVFGNAELTYKEVSDFVSVASPSEKRAVMKYRGLWLNMDEEDVNTTDMTNYIKRTIQEYFAVSE